MFKVPKALIEIYSGVLRHEDEIEQWEENNDIHIWALGDGGFWATLYSGTPHLVHERPECKLSNFHIRESIGIGNPRVILRNR